jgi:hypothetical protein
MTMIWSCECWFQTMPGYVPLIGETGEVTGQWIASPIGSSVNRSRIEDGYKVLFSAYYRVKNATRDGH